jgi:transposase
VPGLAGKVLQIYFERRNQEMPDLSNPDRFIGLDIHKYYLVATAVDRDLNKVYGPRRIELVELQEWIKTSLNKKDAVVLEMSANSWDIYDELFPYVHSVTIVHPPHVALIVRAQVMTDKIAALHLARLHAKGLLTGVWVPPQEIRDLRTLVAQRKKMTAIKTQAKNRLQATLHRHHILPPEGKLYDKQFHSWWLSLPISKLEQVRIQSDLDTLAFSESQIGSIENCMAAWAVNDERIAQLFQLTGVGLVTAVTVISAVGDIHRFPDANHLVGYSGLGARVHDSGLTCHYGGITKSGRKDLRAVLVEAAQIAVLHDPRWKNELARLEPHTGRNKAIVAIARKLLVIMWHILTKHEAEKYLNLERLGRKYYEFAYTVGKANWDSCSSANAFIRQQMDLAGVGKDLASFHYAGRNIVLPPSSLVQK